MINIDTLAIVLRALGRAESTRSPAPVAGVVRVAQVKPLTVDKALSPTGTDQNGTPAPEPDAAFEPDAGAPREQRVANEGAASVPEAVRTAPQNRIQQAAWIPTPASASRIALSSAGSLLLDALKAPDEHGTPTVRPHAPLLASPPSDAPTLARALEHAVTRSGMFYESHVARWAHDDFAVEELAQEPQWHWNASPPSDSVTKPVSLPHSDAPLLVRQQLEAHEAHRVMLDAQLWPGQPARVVFEEAGHTREHTSDGPSHACAPAWSAQIDIVLDSLGPVSAVLALQGDRLDIRLNVADERAGDRLQHARRELEQSLAAGGIDLTRLAIGHG